MYYLPELYATRNYSVDVVSEEVTMFKEQSLFLGDNYICRDKHIYEICQILMSENRLSIPTTVYESLNLYLTLRQSLYELL